MTFLKGVIRWIGENRRAETCARRDLERASSPAIDQPFGETPWGKSEAGRKEPPRGQRVLDGLSGARAGGRVPAAPKVFNTLSFENEI
jgi:hypothetical protein